MKKPDKSRKQQDVIEEQLRRQFDGIRDEDIPERLLKLARRLQERLQENEPAE